MHCPTGQKGELLPPSACPNCDGTDFYIGPGLYHCQRCWWGRWEDFNGQLHALTPAMSRERAQEGERDV